MERRVSINLLYFGLFFAFLVLTSVASLFLRENLAGSRAFFLLYSVGQAFLETSLLVFLGATIRRFLGNLCFQMFVGMTFVLLVLHLFDFLMGQILDLSVWEVIDSFVFSESLGNFLYLLDASGIPIWVWMVFFGAVAALPFLGMALYRVTEKISLLSLRREWFIQSFFCLPAALLFWDFSASRVIHPDAYTGLLQALPWKFTFLQPQTVFFPVAGSFQRPLPEEEMKKQIAADQTVLAKKPNIYLFVVESLREELIDEEVAPHLGQFRKQALHADMTLSNANGSALSWFSIFHSQFPICWEELQKEGWSMGSPPLNLLKKWGYKIHLYTSAQLGYYGMEELLFGKERKLLDTYKTFHHLPPMSAADTDAQAVEQLKKDLASNPDLHEGQVFLIFLDATHFNYSWPKQWSPKFTPFAKEFGYFGVFFSPHTIELIKNRYRNAIHYVDSLFGEFLECLPRSEEAIVTFLGDHGEEFLEKGHLFHGSHLVREQTQVPLYMRLGSKTFGNIEGIFSQVDIFPTLLHYLSNSAPSYLVGQSAFSAKRRPYTLMARFNAGRAPYEFCLQNLHHKLVARFQNRRQIFQSRALKIRSLRNRADQTIPETKKEPEVWLQREFGAALEYLFSNELP